MSKKGFTLVELLAVIVILSVILILVFPAVSSVLRRSKNTIEDVQINKILKSTYDYSLKNINILPEKEQVNYITLNELKNAGLVEANIKQATTHELFPNDLVISIRYVGNNYKNSSINSIMKGNYLYTVESEFMNTEKFKENKPTITFNGYDSDPIVIELNIGDSYSSLEYTAISANGEDLTDKVTINITYNLDVVGEINTMNAGIYNIYYSVVDSNGYSALATVNVIVHDMEKPTLIVPDNVTDGVSCTDNSNHCAIETNGNITFGKIGKYVIEYISYDPSGNTSTKKRVITVE